jgi:hypothetical protein
VQITEKQRIKIVLWLIRDPFFIFVTGHDLATKIPSFRPILLFQEDATLIKNS